jgi:hypothetical protein
LESHIIQLARNIVVDATVTLSPKRYFANVVELLWNAVENYSNGKLLKAKDEREYDYPNQKRRPQEEQITYMVADVKSKANALITLLTGANTFLDNKGAIEKEK